ncbi:MAG: carboxypeptidase-like regulatory domain-containing protein [Alphaproteobacteria bacterium]|nr:carboxypeptidase-like regulatory domain-containing protein [Alphaproteobacteria bacterium]
MRQLRPGTLAVLWIAVAGLGLSGCGGGSVGKSGRGAQAEFAGRVVSASGSPVAGAVVALQVADASGGRQAVQQVVSDGDGRYQLTAGPAVFASAAGDAQQIEVQATAPQSGGRSAVQFPGSERLPDTLPDLMLPAELPVLTLDDRSAMVEVPGRVKLCGKRIEWQVDAANGPGVPIRVAAGDPGIPRLWMQELDWEIRAVAATRAKKDGVKYLCTAASPPVRTSGASPPPLTRARSIRLTPPGLAFAGFSDGVMSNALSLAPGRGAVADLTFGMPVVVRRVLLYGLLLAEDNRVVVRESRTKREIASAFHDGGFVLDIPLPQIGPRAALELYFPGSILAVSEIAAYGPVDLQNWTPATPASSFSNAVESTDVR